MYLYLTGYCQLQINKIYRQAASQDTKVCPLTLRMASHAWSYICLNVEYMYIPDKYIHTNFTPVHVYLYTL